MDLWSEGFYARRCDVYPAHKTLKTTFPFPKEVNNLWNHHIVALSWVLDEEGVARSIVFDLTLDKVMYQEDWVQAVDDPHQLVERTIDICSGNPVTRHTLCQLCPNMIHASDMARSSLVCGRMAVMEDLLEGIDQHAPIRLVSMDCAFHFPN